MKDKYNIKSERYGYTHELVASESDDSAYFINPQDTWMNIRVIFNEDNKSIFAIDLDGGPFITRGWRNDEIEVVDIFIKDKIILLMIKEIGDEEI